MNEHQLSAEINAFCSTHGDIALVKKYSRYFKEEYNAWGVSRELLEQECAGILDNNDLIPEVILRAGDHLFRNGRYEEGSMALCLLRSIPKKYDKTVFQGIASWFEHGVNNWAHCDAICGDILSVFLKKSIIVPIDFSDWVTSASRFRRRAVPVSLIKHLKSGAECGQLLKLTEPLMMDKERVVHQGMGWFLREAWKIHPVLTEDFLYKWKDTAPRLIIQYATEKMDAKTRTRFRRSKS
ncbi:MAG: DNA alkylation repair protein [Bacteroidia bacterium]|nr:DNA alkylation repair protein [Bacteroidia bacterium]